MMSRIRVGLEFPVVLICLAFFVITAFQAQQMLRERANLAAIQAAQMPAMEQGQKLRAQLDLLAGETVRLAEAGNQGAKEVVDQMQKLGVTMRHK